MFAFLGTAIGFVFEGLRLNLTLLVVCISFLLMLLVSGYKVVNQLNTKLLVWFFIASMPGSIIAIFNGNGFILSLIQILGVTVFWLVVLMIFSRVSFSLTSVFSIYLHSARIAAFVGLVQQIAYQLGFDLFWDLRWLLIGAAEPTFSGNFLRVSSFFTEPSYFAVFLMPALYFSVLRLTNSSRLVNFSSGFMFILALINTFSAIGFVGFILCVFVSLEFQLRKLIFPLLLISFTVVIAFFSPEVASRFSMDSFANPFEITGAENFSLFNNLINLNISMNMFFDHSLFGVGLGAYRVHSIDYLSVLSFSSLDLGDLPSDVVESLTLSDGGSMYLRLVPELGLVGLMIFFLIFFKRRGKVLTEDEKFISNGALLFIVIYSIRSGQLIRFEFIYFCALYSLVRFSPRFRYGNCVLNDRND